MTRILGIETSCDETAVAIVQDGVIVEHSTVLSQIAVHKPFGGVIPELAAREHLSNLPVIWERVKEAADPSSVDAVAVTQGPGLVGALLVGTAFARSFASGLGIPLIPINHIHAHMFGGLLGLSGVNDPDELLPLIGLVVSGGHTNLYFLPSWKEEDWVLLSYSRDDACGECFDKVARLLGLGYPGGPAVEREAKEGVKGKFALPKRRSDLAMEERMFFSYSGLKTHMVNLVRGKSDEWIQENRASLCADFQEAALMQIIERVVWSLEQFPQAKGVLVSGGVAANHRFRALADEFIARPSWFPKLAYCGDNAAMVASAGYFKLRELQSRDSLGSLVSSFAPQASWQTFSRYPFAELYKF